MKSFEKIHSNSDAIRYESPKCIISRILFDIEPKNNDVSNEVTHEWKYSFSIPLFQELLFSNDHKMLSIPFRQGEGEGDTHDF